MDQDSKTGRRYQMLALVSCFFGLAFNIAALVTGWHLLIAVAMIPMCVGMMFIIVSQRAREGRLGTHQPQRTHWIVAVCSLLMSIVSAWFVAVIAGWAGWENPNVRSLP